MLDLEPKQHVEWNRDDLRRTQYSYLQTMRLPVGVSLWSFNLLTRKCEKVIFKTKADSTIGDMFTPKVNISIEEAFPPSRREIHVMYDTLYTAAINQKNAMRKFQNMQLALAINSMKKAQK